MLLVNPQISFIQESELFTGRGLIGFANSLMCSLDGGGEELKVS